MRHDALRSLGPQAIPLFNAEAVLLVHNHQAQIVKVHRVLQQRMGSDDDAREAGRHIGLDLLLRRRRHRTGEQRDAGRIVGRTQFPCRR
ncbi:Uncharacterised protein [Mycobacteroides abscessus subsp. massiliense]|nr:Uncharacterised protein [Mycobacteroides abscessus subsp. massiliense]